MGDLAWFLIEQQQQQQVGREGGREGRTDASLMPPGGGA